MEIKKWNGVSNLNKGYMAYQKVTSQATIKNAASTEVKARPNVDKMAFDFSRVLEAAKADVTAKVNAGTSTKRLGELESQYGGENCNVSSADTAEKIVKKK